MNIIEAFNKLKNPNLLIRHEDTKFIKINGELYFKGKDSYYKCLVPNCYSISLERALSNNWKVMACDETIFYDKKPE